MDTPQRSAGENINLLLAKTNAAKLTPTRIKDWHRVIKWEVEGEEFYWVSEAEQLETSQPAHPDFILKCSKDTLERVASNQLPFFIGLWGTGSIAFEGSFADAYKLGYIFLSDKRKRRVIFISHCWLNINTRFPEGCAFEGANVPLIKTLLDSGLGIIQMPCPEYECLGLEKQLYGEIIKDELRTCFRKSASIVAKQIKDYQDMGFEIVGVLGMNPSPSCGVGVAKGKCTMLGTGRDTSEQMESGIFIEELESLLTENRISNINIFGIRRVLVGETGGMEERIAYLKSQINA
jgi:predicted secreted protein